MTSSRNIHDAFVCCRRQSRQWLSTAYRAKISAQSQRRAIHSTRRSQAVKPFLLADIGEGITECQLIQWFVQPGARVEQFDKLCEVQSDKAAVEITSPFDGVIKTLHYEPDDMAITGRPLVDIDIQGAIETAHKDKLGNVDEAATADEQLDVDCDVQAERCAPTTGQSVMPGMNSRGLLATPAVRHLMKELHVSIEDVHGTGRDGRVLKQDVRRHVQSRSTTVSTSPSSADSNDEQTALTPVQNQMFMLMSRSLSIPHFLYSCSTDMTAASVLRHKLNSRGADKITAFAMILKAVSLAFGQHPLLNASLDTSVPSKPLLTYHKAHHFGIAVDTSSGLLVPVIRDVQILGIHAIADQIRDVSARARSNKLSPIELRGATFTLSNIGSIGGGVVSPIISEPQVAILGIGRSRVIPAFDNQGSICKREELIMSWSADHRVVDGAECAKCAERVRSMLEEPDLMLVEMS